MPDCAKCIHLESEHDGVCTHYFQTCDCDGYEEEPHDPSPNSGAASDPDPALTVVGQKGTR